MSDIGVIVDSGASFEPEFYKENGIVPVQLVFTFPGEAPTPDFEMPPEEFYPRLIATEGKKGAVPTTSAANETEITDAYDRLFSEGAKKIIMLTLLDAASGTYNMALQAKEKHPLSKDIEVKDTNTVGPSQGFIALEVKRYSETHGFDETLAYADKLSTQSKIYAVPSTLKFLHAGGRVSDLQYRLGVILDYHPVVSVVNENGRHVVKQLAKERKFEKAVGKMEDKILASMGEFSRQDGTGTVDFMVLETGNKESADLLEKKLKVMIDGYGLKTGHAMRGYLPAVLGTHLGPGAVGVGMLYRGAE
ncbi:DegV family EDD domain-containing protein [Candidatus Woesearchaeota archaeon]|nr:DegV family EDD domain-containing protein [Candidatus Woesearchaeota archaeon]